MRRMCGLSSQIRNRSLLKSMRNMVRPGQAKRYTGVNHIAALVKEWLRSRTPDRGRTAIFLNVVPANAGTHTPQPLNLGGESRYCSPTTKACGYGSLRSQGRRRSGPELLAQDAFLEAVTGIEQHPHRNRLVGQHLDAADVAHVVMIGGGRNRTLFVLEHLDHHEGGVGEQ